MLIREDGRGTLAIGQPSHAWLSGQLARAWGNDAFGPVWPREEVCLAAEQHDLGWDARDLEPLLNSGEGRPRSFMEMPLGVHLGLFSDGPRRMLTQSRYAALLVSMHGARLYERRDLSETDPTDAAAIGSFLCARHAFQQRLLEALRDDPATAGAATPAVLERNSMLIWTWDYLSLALCLGWDPATARRAPTADGEVDLRLHRAAGAPGFALEPWPFAADRVLVRCEARRLTARFDDEGALRKALERAHWETLEFELLQP